MDTFWSHATLTRFTALGDPTFLLCVALGAFFYLWVSYRRRLAGHLALAVGLCVALTVSAKLAFLLAHDAHHGIPLRSPSGHVAIATTVYGCCIMMLATRSGRLVRLVAMIGIAVFLLALAGTRLALRLHNISEIAVGFLIGTACLLIFARGSRTDLGPFEASRLAALLLLLGVTRFARIDAEEMIAYGARLTTLLSRSWAGIEQSAALRARPYQYEQILPGQFSSLSKGATSCACGGKDG